MYFTLLLELWKTKNVVSKYYVQRYCFYCLVNNHGISSQIRKPFRSLKNPQELGKQSINSKNNLSNRGNMVCFFIFLCSYFFM